MAPVVFHLLLRPRNWSKPETVLCGAVVDTTRRNSYGRRKVLGELDEPPNAAWAHKYGNATCQVCVREHLARLDAAHQGRRARIVEALDKLERADFEGSVKASRHRYKRRRKVNRLRLRDADRLNVIGPNPKADQ